MDATEPSANRSATATPSFPWAGPAQHADRVLDVGARERLREVDEMAHLAEQAPALAPVEIPVAVGDPARGDPVDDQLRRLSPRPGPAARPARRAPSAG